MADTKSNFKAPGVAQEEVDIRALPLLSDEDIVYLGMSDSAQRRKLLHAARSLKSSAAQPLKPPWSTRSACQPPSETNPRSSEVDCRSLGQTGNVRSQSSRDTPRPSQSAPSACQPLSSSAHCSAQGDRNAPPQTIATGSQSNKDASEGRVRLESSTAPAQQGCTGVKRTAADAFGAASPESNGDSDFAEEPARQAPPAPRLARLGKAALTARKMGSSGPKAQPPSSAAAGPSLQPCQTIEGLQNTLEQGSKVVQPGTSAHAEGLTSRPADATGSAQEMPYAAPEPRQHGRLQVPEKVALLESSQPRSVAAQGQVALTHQPPVSSSALSPLQQQPAHCLQGLQGLQGLQAEACSGRECPELAPAKGEPGFTRQHSVPGASAKSAPCRSGALGHLLASRQALSLSHAITTASHVLT